MPKIPFYQVTGDAQRALEVFSEEFDAAFNAADPSDLWAEMLGLAFESNAIKTTYPIPVSAAGYEKREGDDRMRRLYQRSLSVFTEEWQDGVEEKRAIIEAPDFIGWAGEPGRMAVEAFRHGNTLTAQMLEANANLDFYADPNIGLASTRALFADDHPYNVFKPELGSFDNDQTGTAIDATLVKDVKTRFRQRLAANGKPMGLRVTHVLVPAAREEEAKDFFQEDLLREVIRNQADSDNVAAIGTRRNRHTDVSLVVSDELTDSNVIYFLDARPQAPKPWILQTAPMEEIQYGVDSDRYKDTGFVGVKRILTQASTGCLPHAIERVTLS